METGTGSGNLTTERLKRQSSRREAVSANRKLQGIVTAILSLVLSSCASTELSHTWRDPSYDSGPLNRLLVVAVRKNQETRRAWEDAFAAALSRHGVDVTPSYHLFPETLPDTGLIGTVTRDRSFDGIVLIGRVSVKSVQGVTAGYDITSPDYPSHPWDAWYYTYYNREFYPGYPVVSGIVRDQIQVWATHGGTRMVWTGEGAVEGGGGRDGVRRAITDLIVPELVRQGIIAAGS